MIIKTGVCEQYKYRLLPSLPIYEHFCIVLNYAENDFVLLSLKEMT